MKIKVDLINGINVVALDGELNVEDSIKLRDSFIKLLKAGASKVIVDFEKVGFVGSSGLATLIEMTQMLKKANGKFNICNVNKEIRGIFEITKMHKMISIHDNRETALKELS
ncbi:MAG: STAS domain-containing protein [Candidatus Omnitrophica bacterium]|nr:STAS domain-containing protein [Candidatus Omnitrophota bacterium]